MAENSHNKERRNARRFQVAWDVSVNGIDHAGNCFDEAGKLGNLSSGGAFFFLHGRVEIGATLEVQIRTPYKKNNWMKYSAQVVRVEEANGNISIAVRFATALPIFFDK